MNVVQEIRKINERELDLGTKGSWHDDYKDSAYIFAGGLHRDLTEGDVITIFSQYGEVMDVNMPRDKETGKPKGFAFLMYEDQRSTVLAVDNLNGAKVLDRTLRVDHVKDYKQPKVKDGDGEWQEREEQSLNAKPQLVTDGNVIESSDGDSGPEIDPEDPMRDYLIAKWKEEKAKKGKKSKSKRKHEETPEERQARKERKKLKKEKGKSAGMKAAEELLNSLYRPGLQSGSGMIEVVVAVTLLQGGAVAPATILRLDDPAAVRHPNPLGATLVALLVRDHTMTIGKTCAMTIPTAEGLDATMTLLRGHGEGTTDVNRVGAQFPICPA
ncbi:hypothetical protein C8Q79DRAFT_1006726 [Trametes meyenii]|nr:hypothetical protein C8Q79DRAFT_1006726 [Trametes meyenii]